MTSRTLPLHFEDTNYSLIEIHSSIEPFQLAYYINDSLKLKLCRTSEDIAKTPNELFSVFEYEDVLNQQSWQLFNNKSVQENISSQAKSLFDQAPAISYLIPEKKEVDSFLKFSPGAITIENCLEILRKIPQISACYELCINRLKSKNNLIFG